MYAGTLARLAEPADAPFETATASDGGLPALAVEETQRTLNNRPVQEGTAATGVTTAVDEVSVNDSGGDVSLVDDTRVVEHQASTEWVADPVGTGLVVPASVRGDTSLSFPLDLFAAQADRDVERLGVLVDQLYAAWDRDATVADVWMTTTEDADGTEIAYHDTVDRDTEPTLGVGFERQWNGDVYTGVVFRSGYVAVYDAEMPATFVRYAAEEVLPHAFVQQDPDDEEDGEGDDQSTLPAGGGVA